jgi:hypothetical protein
MQGTNSGAGKPKRPKLPADKPEINDSSTSESTVSESAPSGPTVETSVISEPTIDDLFIIEPAVKDPNEIEASAALTNNAHCPDTDEILSRADAYTGKQGDGTIGQHIEGDVYIITHDDGMALLDGFFPNSPVGLGPVDDAFALDTPLRLGEENVQDCTLAVAQSHTSEPLTAPHRPSNAGPDATFPASGTPRLLNPDQTPEIHDANNNLSCAAVHTHSAKRMILDESGHQLEDVIKALKEADDTSRIPNSYIPGVSEYLLDKSASTDYSKIMTSLAIHCVRCNRRMAMPALDVERERLQELERNELERIAQDRQQMNMTLPARIASEMNYQQYEERLRKITENTIASLDVRELAERELQDIISEPTELTGEFREKSDYENAIKQIEKEKANDTRTRQRRLWKETYYWPIIQ